MSISQPACWLAIDKPPEHTSHDLVARARKRLGFRRIGHTGTLDPDATGVLVLAIGKATRLIQYLPGGKAYRALIRLGISTNSYDASGQVLAEAPVPELTEQDLRERLAGFLGPQQQIPPMVSAVSINGKRLYELARQGIEIERPARSVEFYTIELLRWESPWLEIEVSCSAGTYIRSLAHDLGQQLGCGACLQTLRRTRAHAFTLEQAILLENLQPLSEAPDQGLPADWPLQHLPAVTLKDETDVKALRQGQAFAQTQASGLVRLYTPTGEFAALGEAEGSLIRPKLLLIDPITEKTQTSATQP